MAKRLFFGLLILFIGCATARYPERKQPKPKPGCATFHVDNQHWLDVVVRSAVGRRLGVAPGLSRSRFVACGLSGQQAVVVLDPIGSRETERVEFGGVYPPGESSNAFLEIGSALNISFFRVVW